MSTTQTQAPQAVKPGLVIGLCSAAGSIASFILGGVLVHDGKAAGLFFIALPVLAAVIAIVVLIGRELSRDLRKERAWKATLTPQQRLGVEIAETAALYATWAAVRHSVKESHERSAATWQAGREASRADSELHRQQVADASAYQAANWGPR